LVFSFFLNFDFFTELAGLNEEAYGLSSTTISNDLNAPSVPVEPVNVPMSTKKVSICYLFEI